jgi:hypothetical protein
MSKQKLMLAELLGEVPYDALERGKVSHKEYKDIQMLIRFDKDMFALESNIHTHNDLHSANPYNFFVDFQRLPAKIPVKIK